jgi:formylglycine-generating enzyme required for sulfatase activity
MHGNTWEWCEDDWHDNYEGAPTNGTAWLSPTREYSVIRGGSCYNTPLDCRSASRLYIDPYDDIYDYVGFRVVSLLPRKY